MATNNLTPVTFTANDNNVIEHDGNPLTIYCSGTFGGGNIVIESSPDGTEYIEENAAATTTFNWTIGKAVAAGMKIRVTLAGSTSPTLLVSYFRGTRKQT